MDMKHGGNVWEGANPDHWLDFSANLRPEGIPEWVMCAMQDALSDTRFYPDRAMRSARRGLAAYLGVDENCVLPTSGGAAAIDLMLSRQTGSVHVNPHTFGEYAERACVHGREVHIWTGDCANGDTVMLCNPNNPTGSVRRREELLTLHRRMAASGGELIVDEAFIDFCPEHSVRGDVQKGLSVVGSLTKTLCIPGIRLGYVCAVPEVITELQNKAVTWSLNTLASAVAAELPAHMDEIKADALLNQQRRERFAQRLAGLGAEVMPSHSNFLLVDFQRDMTDAAAILKGKGTLVRTCASFGLGPEYWRLAVKTEEENEKLIGQLEEILCAANR